MIGGLKPYLVNKDSGVEWLGEVPVRLNPCKRNPRVLKRAPTASVSPDSQGYQGQVPRIALDRT